MANIVILVKILIFVDMVILLNVVILVTQLGPSDFGEFGKAVDSGESDDLLESHNSGACG